MAGTEPLNAKAVTQTEMPKEARGDGEDGLN